MPPPAPDPAKKLAAQAALAEMRANFLADLPAAWQQLRATIAASRQAPEDLYRRSAALSHAHKLRGASGALDLAEVSNLAGSIEDTLERIYAGLSDEPPSLWSEIDSLLDQGDSFGARDGYGG